MAENSQWNVKIHQTMSKYALLHHETFCERKKNRRRDGIVRREKLGVKAGEGRGGKRAENTGKKKKVHDSMRLIQGDLCLGFGFCSFLFLVSCFGGFSSITLVLLSFLR